MENLAKHELLDAFVSRGKKSFGSSLVSVVLFGSFASGTAKEFSDVDLLVIAEDLPKDWRKGDEIALELEGVWASNTESISPYYWPRPRSSRRPLRLAPQWCSGSRRAPESFSRRTIFSGSGSAYWRRT